MKKLLIAVLLLGLMSCEKEAIIVQYEILAIDINGQGVNGISYKITFDKEMEGYTEYMGTTGFYEVEGGETLVIEGWTDNPEYYVNIRINDIPSIKKGYNIKTIKN